MISRRGLVLSLVVLFFGLSVTPADAFIFRRWRRRRTRSTYTASYQFSGTTQQIAQQKVQILARRGRVFHPGGSFGSATHEGVGSGSTPQAALNACCFSGARGSKGPKRHCIAAATAQSASGRWYAVRLYR